MSLYLIHLNTVCKLTVWENVLIISLIFETLFLDHKIHRHEIFICLTSILKNSAGLILIMFTLISSIFSCDLKKIVSFVVSVGTYHREVLWFFTRWHYILDDLSGIKYWFWYGWSSLTLHYLRNRNVCIPYSMCAIPEICYWVRNNDLPTI